MRLRAALLVLAATTAVAQDGPPPLPLGAPVKGVATKAAPATFVVEAKSAGVVTTVVTGEGDADLVVYVCDDEGQPLPEYLDGAGQLNPGARADRDVLGARGTEALAALVPAPGRYLVVVEAADGADGRFSISGSFTLSPALARPADADGRPGAAVALTAGAQLVEVSDKVDPRENDVRDWFAVRAARAGTLSVVLRAPEGDLRLDAYARSNLRAPVQQSDDDQQGIAGNESISVTVKEGDVVLVRVSAVFLHADRAAYRLATAVVAQ